MDYRLLLSLGYIFINLLSLTFLTYVHEAFTGEYKATIGADFLTKHLIIDDQAITMQVIQYRNLIC